jgi:hypothetical protein
LIRSFTLEARDAPGFGAAQARVEVVDAGGEATWLALEADVRGVPLSAQLTLTRGGVVSVWEATLHPGGQLLAIDPAGLDGVYDLDLRLFGLDGEHVLPRRSVRVQRAGRPPPPLPTARLGALQPMSGGHAILASAGAQPALVSWRLGAGPWSAEQAPGPIALPALAPGSHDLLLRARSAANAAVRWAEAPLVDQVRLVVDSHGGLTVRR